MQQNLNYRDPISRREKGHEKILKTLQMKISPTGKENSQLSPRGTKSAIQDKPKEKHTKTHTNQSKNKHKERILKAAREYHTLLMTVAL